MKDNYHIPVLLNVVLENILNPEIKEHIIVDCTVGGGGHSIEIAKKIAASGRLICIDRDENAIEYSVEKFKRNQIKAEFIKGNFAELKKLLYEKNVKYVSGVLIDLGLSSYQIESEEGFSFMQNTKLDMRVDKSQSLKASDVINKSSKKELDRIFREFGEIKNFNRLTNAILQSRNRKNIETTFDLIEILKKDYKHRISEKFLAKIFQALRIYVNNELENLKKVLKDSFELLVNGGRLVIISYHSLEDRIVKNFFRENSIKKLSQLQKFPFSGLEIITKKPIIPDENEIKKNRKSRSAKLRAAEVKFIYGI